MNAPAAKLDAPRASQQTYIFLPTRLKRARFLVWLRRTHAWIGLWGACLGLLFGSTGILLNHRAEMKIPLAKTAEAELRLTPPAAALVSAQAMEHWLRTRFDMATAKARITEKPAGPAPWGDGSVQQPAHWKLNLNRLGKAISADYWQGDATVKIDMRTPNAFATLTRLHMGSGMGTAWILFADTLGAGLMVLALTGGLLWSRLHGQRLLALGLAGGCLTALLGIALRSL